MIVGTIAPTGTTSAHVCPLEEGMGSPQNYLTYVINGDHKPQPADITPGSNGVTFLSTFPASIQIDFNAPITPIVISVAIANNKITNVKVVFVEIAPNGTKLQSSGSDNIVTGFPKTPLAPGTSLLITFKTDDGQPAYGVTLSIIACYQPTASTTAFSTTKATSGSSRLLRT